MTPITSSSPFGLLEYMYYQQFDTLGLKIVLC